MSCITWSEYCSRFADSGIFDPENYAPESSGEPSNAYLKDSPAYLGYKNELAPIQLDQNDVIYMARNIVSGDFYIGFPDDLINGNKGGNYAKYLENMLRLCKPITITSNVSGCKCFTITAVPAPSITPITFTDYFYTKAQVFSNAPGYGILLYYNGREYDTYVDILAKSPTGDDYTWYDRITMVSQSDLPNIPNNYYDILPNYWLRMFSFDSKIDSLIPEDNTRRLNSNVVRAPINANMVKAHMRGDGLNFNLQFKTTGINAQYGAASPMMNAALANLSESFDAGQQRMASAFKNLESVTNNFKSTQGDPCSNDLFMVARHVEPGGDQAVRFICGVSAFQGPLTISFGPSRADLTMVKNTFDWIYKTLKDDCNSSDSNILTVVDPANMCYFYQDSDTVPCCQEVDMYMSPSGSTTGWDDSELWSAYSKFDIEGWTPPADWDYTRLVVFRKSYVHRVLSSDILLRRLVVSDNLFSAIEECFQNLVNDYCEGEKPSPGGGGEEEELCPYRDNSYTWSYCNVDINNPITFANSEYGALAKIPAVAQALINCQSLSGVSTCSGLVEIEEYQGLIIARDLTSYNIAATCNSEDCAMKGSPNNLSNCCCEGGAVSGQAWDEDSQTCIKDADSWETCTQCDVLNYSQSPDCQINVTTKHIYDVVKQFYQENYPPHPSKCLYSTIATGGSLGASYEIPFLNYRWDEELNNYLYSTSSTDYGDIEFDPNKDPTQNPNDDGSGNGGESHPQKGGGGGGSGGGGGPVYPRTPGVYHRSALMGTSYEQEPAGPDGTPGRLIKVTKPVGWKSWNKCAQLGWARWAFSSMVTNPPEMDVSYCDHINGQDSFQPGRKYAWDPSLSFIRRPILCCLPPGGSAVCGPGETYQLHLTQDPNNPYNKVNTSTWQLSGSFQFSSDLTYTYIPGSTVLGIPALHGTVTYRDTSGGYFMAPDGSGMVSVKSTDCQGDGVCASSLMSCIMKVRPKYNLQNVLP